jgi:PAS domain S-box-containing protein
MDTPIVPDPARHAAERLACIVEASPSGLLEVDGSGRITLVNRHVEAMFGYDRSELLGRPVEMLVPERFRGEHVAQRRHFAAAAETREMGAGRIITGLRRDGSEFPVEIGLNPLPVAGAQHVLAAVQDISRRHAETLEKERQRQELERSNADLAEFAHAASHDLKAPLRGMAHLAEWIAEDIGPGAAPQVLENLALLRARATRLQTLLTGLLSYAKVGRGTLVLETVECASLVREVTANLSLPEGFRVEMPEPMPTIRTFRVLLEGVLQNLIDNAVKHHDKGTGVVSVTAEREGDAGGGKVVFTVADDGPGIQPRFHKRIFQIFQTLVPRDELEASGLGLAIVKRKVELNGGTIHVESNPPERGTRFVFTWPDGPPA